MQLRLVLNLLLLWDSLPATLSFSTCKTIDMEQIRKKRIEAIRGQILSKLKLSSPPEAQQVTVTKEVMTLYNSTKELLGHLGKEQGASTVTQADYYAKEVHRFGTLQDKSGNKADNDPYHKIYRFNISLNVSSDSFLHRAEFRLYRLVLSDAEVEEQRVELYQVLTLRHTRAARYQRCLRKILQIPWEDRRTIVGVLDQANIPSIEALTTLDQLRWAGHIVRMPDMPDGIGQVRSNGNTYLDNRLLQTKGNDEWISFDVTETVKEWVLNGVTDQQLKISVHCPCEAATFKLRKNLQVKFYGTPRGDLQVLAQQNPKMPHILMMSTPSTRADAHSRRKRDLDTDFCFASAEEKNCCVRPMYIDFRKDLGWKWIHEPKGYYANFCMGPCPYIWSTDTQYTTVLALYNMHNPGASASPCCVPQVLESLPILYYVGRQPKVEQLSNMIVKSCKCS